MVSENLYVPGGRKMNIRRWMMCLVMLVSDAAATACSQNTVDQIEEADTVQGKDENIVSESRAVSGQNVDEAYFTQN